LGNLIDSFSILFSLKSESEISPLRFKLSFFFVAPAEIRTMPSMVMGLMMVVFESLLLMSHSWQWQASILEKGLRALFGVRFDNTKVLPMIFLTTMLPFVLVSLAMASSGMAITCMPRMFLCPVAGIQYLSP